MGKSLRSKSKVKFRNIKRSKIFEPVEEARRKRLAEKLLGHVKEAIKESKKVGGDNDDEMEVEDEEESEEKKAGESDGKFCLYFEREPGLTNGLDIEVDDAKPKPKTGGWKKKVKKNRSFKGRRKR